MVNRVTQANRPEIASYITHRFNEISARNAGRIGLVSMWDVQLEIEEKWGISATQSQNLTWAAFWDLAWITLAIRQR